MLSVFGGIHIRRGVESQSTVSARSHVESIIASFDSQVAIGTISRRFVRHRNRSEPTN